MPYPATTPERYSIYTIGGGFPPGLNTAQPATDIAPDETPDAFGFDLTLDGVLAKGTIPDTAVARIERLVIPYKAWAASTAYAVGDLRYTPTTASLYVCITAHTSASAFATDAAKWQSLTTDYSAYLWAPSTAYSAGNIVVRNNPSIRYLCQTAHTSSATYVEDATYWITIGSSYSAWAGSTSYAVGAMVTQGTSPKLQYVCKTAHTSTGTFANDSAYWVAVTSDYIWATGLSYVAGQMVLSSGTRYVCKSNHTAGATFAGDAASWQEITTTTPPCYWHYNRLWNITNNTVATASNLLRYGATNYDDIFIPQKLGSLSISEDTQTILCLIPMGDDSLFIAKSTGGFVLSNLSDSRAIFGRTDVAQEMLAAQASRYTVLDGVVYASNTEGLFALAQGKVTEVTRKCRNYVVPWAIVDLNCDYYTKYVICGQGGVYDAQSGKLFSYLDRYSLGTGFLYTTRQFHLPDYAPFIVDRVLLVVQHGDTGNGSLTYQVKFEDEAWSTPFQLEIPYGDDKYTVVSADLNESRSVRKFQMRITNIVGTKYIKEIKLDHAAFNADDYSA